MPKRYNAKDPDLMYDRYGLDFFICHCHDHTPDLSSVGVKKTKKSQALIDQQLRDIQKCFVFFKSITEHPELDNETKQAVKEAMQEDTVHFLTLKAQRPKQSKCTIL